MNFHELKILECYFEAVRDGRKTFEIRKNDRDFRTGDYLILREIYQGGAYTGRAAIAKVTYVLNDEKYLQPGYVALGIDARGLI